MTASFEDRLAVLARLAERAGFESAEEMWDNFHTLPRDQQRSVADEAAQAGAT